MTSPGSSRAVYQQVGGANYLYHWQPHWEWKIAPDYTSGSRAIASEDTSVECPEYEQRPWRTGMHVQETSRKPEKGDVDEKANAECAGEKAPKTVGGGVKRRVRLFLRREESGVNAQHPRL